MVAVTNVPGVPNVIVGAIVPTIGVENMITAVGGGGKVAVGRITVAVGIGVRLGSKVGVAGGIKAVCVSKKEATIVLMAAVITAFTSCVGVAAPPQETSKNDVKTKESML